MATIKTLEELETFGLAEAVREKFSAALKNGQLVFAPSKHEQYTDEATGMRCELMIVEGLSKRPINRPTQPGSDEKISSDKLEQVKKKNPFMKPEPELTVIQDLVGEYRLILNKFPNIEEHFLMVTKEFVQQDTLLKPVELQLMHTILGQLNTSQSRFFAFFNSGPESGYSQFHKHIQFMKLPPNFEVYQDALVAGSEFFIPRELDGSEQPLMNKQLTFKHFVLKLPRKFASEEEQSTSLAMMYMYLFKRVLNVFKEQGLDSTKISYNFLMMEDWMMIIPRSHAFFDGVWQNSLGFMGLFTMKDLEVKNKVMHHGIGTILQECGFPLGSDDDRAKYDEFGY
ncbi:hypothetical protein OGAPHI_005569 [Ogataea philodendri]|uniref:Uncharacterized protein n=1 Tax=Ogataea philodendri TaxID=1378263 RepID=A0A9P8NY02_9ASCO|nr:uncharacterized protein OGAPHI_005569 [Ogataea philodendri]KAH3662318.1 hypothetical protein OGAPHI_005569 [Ogataea philodendri]